MSGGVDQHAEGFDCGGNQEPITARSVRAQHPLETMSKRALAREPTRPAIQFDEFPKNASVKIDRPAVRRLFEGDAGAQGRQA